jgi:hypothetical protein
MSKKGAKRIVNFESWLSEEALPVKSKELVRTKSWSAGLWLRLSLGGIWE